MNTTTIQPSTTSMQYVTKLESIQTVLLSICPNFGLYLLPKYSQGVNES